MSTRRNFLAGLAAAPLLASQGAAVFAQDSRRAFTMVVPYPPGGSADIFARLFSAALSTQINERIIVENRPGAGGTLGAAHVAAAPPDGRTLLYTLGNLLLNQEFLMKDVRFRAMESLVPVARTCIVQVVIATHANFPANDLREFIAMARRSPGKHSFAYYGDLGIPSMAAEAGINLLRVPYKGGAPGLIDVASGTTDIIASSLTQALPLLRGGRMKLLAVSSDERLAEFPNVPTVKEVVPGYKAIDYQAVYAPKGTPKAVVDQIWQATAKVLASPEFRRSASDRGAIVNPMNPEQLHAFMEQDYANIRATVRASGIQPE
ncbi:MAG: tripartite tricarboxylate transporter substrate binding protein [Burkholderiaceae bacterium]|nr:tripartite tricarboxylate transporter substrate binding protein [Burkholderiaceae bacterium]